MESKRTAWRDAGIIAVGLIAVSGHAAAEPWRFGVMADTQWSRSQNTVASGIISQVNQQFIQRDVKFVIQVGDLVDSYSATNMAVRAAAAQPLYDAGIGFFPLRGNHESSSAAANYVPQAFPQTTGVSQSFGASNFSSPFASLQGLSYSFDYGNSRFVLLDQFTRKDGTGNVDNNIVDQLPWIDSRLSGKPADGHAFVFAHKELIGQDHEDTLFGATPAGNPAAQNTFIASLQNNGVRYAIGGHDHMHHRSLVASPDGQAQVQQIITSSNSYKFYAPSPVAHDVTYNNPPRETPIAQELFTVGYYVFTVDGPRVTVDHFASDNGCGGTLGAGRDCNLSSTPTLDFHWRETFGYSDNGSEFLVKPGDSFGKVADASPTGDGWAGTEMAILDGVNATSADLPDGRTVAQHVNTGWTSRSEGNGPLLSDVLSLWGMANAMGSHQTDPYVLALSFDASGLGGLSADQLASGEVGLVTRDALGNWVNAVDLNVGGTKQFVLGAYDPLAGYGLGTFGLDLSGELAWAVLNHATDFAVASAVPAPGALLLFASAAAVLGRLRRRSPDRGNRA
jgi:hypothetical protein